MLTKTCLALAALAIAAVSASKIPEIPKVGEVKPFINDDVKAKAQTDNKQLSDDPVFYLANGTGSCGIDYRDVSMVACLNGNWMTYKKTCERFIKVFNPENNITVQVQALDTCGFGTKSFGDNDIYLAKKPFLLISGHSDKDNVDAGHLKNKDGKLLQVQWEFVQESCEACWLGQVGRDAFGKMDTCQGPDALGNMRCGRKNKDDRLTTSEQLKGVCTKDFKCAGSF